MRNVSPLLGFFLFTAQCAGAADINVLALTAGKAVLVIDGGKPRTLAVGQMTPEKIKLISATSEAAVVEVAGQRRTLTLGQSISMGSETSGSQRATLTADARGHFFTTATVNGIALRFLVDVAIEHLAHLAQVEVVAQGGVRHRRVGIRYCVLA